MTFEITVRPIRKEQGQLSIVLASIQRIVGPAWVSVNSKDRPPLLAPRHNPTVSALLHLSRDPRERILNGVVFDRRTQWGT